MPRTLRDLPGPRPLPIIGNPLFPLRTVHHRMEGWAREYGPYFRARAANIPLLGVVDAEVIRQCLQDRPDRFIRNARNEVIFDSLGVNGLFSAEGAAWRRQRRLLNPSFHHSHLALFDETLQRITGRLGALWDELARSGEFFEPLPVMMRFTVDVTSALAFGVDLDTVTHGQHELHERISDLFRTLAQRGNIPFDYWTWPFFGRAAAKNVAALEEAMQKLIDDARARADEGEGVRTMLDTMVSARDEDDARHPLTDEELRANVLTLLLAGEETTANTLAFCVDHLARHPDAQARAHAEATTVADARGVPTVEEADGLRYLDACIQETLRMTPPAPMIPLEATEATTVGDIEIEAGTVLLLFTRMIANDPAHYPEPDVFQPERWLDLSPEERRARRKTMLAFGAGPRVCPGRNLALLEAKMALASLLARYEIVPEDPNTPAREVSSFTMLPEGAAVKLVARS